MTILITKKTPVLLQWLGLPILFIILVAFQASPSPKPPIKSKEYKDFVVKANQLQLNKHTRTTYNINGSVIEYAEFELDEKGKKVQRILQVFKYNSEGLLVGTLAYDKNNALIWSKENEYNDSEQIIKKIDIDYTQNARKTYTLLTYNKQGDITTKKVFDQKNYQLSDQKKVYNENSELLLYQEWRYIQKDNKMVKNTITVEYDYDDRGQLSSSTRQEQKGKTKIKDIRLFKNNAMISWIKLRNGKLVSHFKKQKRDSTSVQHEYLVAPPMGDQQSDKLEYDDDKRDPLQYIAHRAYRTITLKSNNDGLPIKKITREYTQVIEVIYYFYNEKNQLSKKQILDKLTHNTLETHYIYDHYENITENTIYKNDSLIQKISYNYQYYN